MPPPPPPPPLSDELVEEILLRIPPDEPELLVRAALACKHWGRLVSCPGFRRRFRERHRTPPLLGVLRSFRSSDGCGTTRFAPTCSFRPRRTDRRGWEAVDCRHGRVLLQREPRSSQSDSVFLQVKPRSSKSGGVLAVWDPITDELRELPEAPQFLNRHRSNGAVLCAAIDCDHLDCSCGHFLVVLVVTDQRTTFSSYVYSSDANAWSEPTSVPYRDFLSTDRAALAGNAVYFLLFTTARILKYDLGTRQMTVLQGPSMSRNRIQLMTAVGGGLGCAMMKGSRLYLWSSEAGPSREMAWSQTRVIEFEKLVPTNHVWKSFDVLGFVDGGGIVYLQTADGCFTTDLKSGQSKKVRGASSVCNTIPYMSFYTPVFGATFAGKGPRADDSLPSQT
ncbi:hypothetical protein ACP70R_046338 [Stipagrostis hirtigluma subsp. patula]